MHKYGNCNGRIPLYFCVNQRFRFRKFYPIVYPIVYPIIYPIIYPITQPLQSFKIERSPHEMIRKRERLLVIGTQNTPHELSATLIPKFQKLKARLFSNHNQTALFTVFRDTESLSLFFSKLLDIVNFFDQLFRSG